jgi:hypothetical protein
MSGSFTLLGAVRVASAAPASVAADSSTSPPATPRAARASQASPELSQVSGPARAAQPATGEAAAPPRRTGLFGLVQRHQERKVSYQEFNSALQGIIGERHRVSASEARALSKSMRDIHGNDCREHVLEMARGIFVNYGYGESYRTASGLQLLFKNTLFDRHKRKHLASIAAVPAEVTIANAQTTEEIASVRAALFSAGKLRGSMTRKDYINVDKYFSGRSLNETSHIIRNSSSQIVRDLFLRPYQVEDLYSGLPLARSKNKSVQNRIIGPIQEALTTLGPELSQRQKDALVMHTVRLIAVAGHDLKRIARNVGSTMKGVRNLAIADSFPNAVVNDVIFTLSQRTIDGRASEQDVLDLVFNPQVFIDKGRRNIESGEEVLPQRTFDACHGYKSKKSSDESNLRIYQQMNERYEQESRMRYVEANRIAMRQEELMMREARANLASQPVIIINRQPLIKLGPIGLF